MIITVPELMPPMVQAVTASNAAPASPPPPTADIAHIAASGDVAAARAFIQAHPDQQEALLTALAGTRPWLIYDVVQPSGGQAASAATPQAETPSLGTRIWGGVRAVGGVLEGVGAGALLLAPEPTGLTKIGGAAAGLNALDNIQTGVRQAWTGRTTDSLTQQAAAGTARALGADETTARRIGVGVDITAGLAGGALPALTRLGTRAATVWESIEAVGATRPGTVIPQSFKLSTGSGQVFVASNATKHLAEYAGHLGASGVAPEATRLVSQIQLSSLRAAVQEATSGGVPYGRLVNVGGWELKFAPPRAAGELPALIHALPMR